MHLRHQHLNIPTEIVRTLVVVAQTGSFTKAAAKLALSQPAISAQMKRLQMLVGGPVFERETSHLVFTPRGQRVLEYAKQMLDANDHILALAGGACDPQPIRVGLSNLYVESFFCLCSTDRLADLAIHCEQSLELSRKLLDGYIDIACVLDPPKQTGEVIADWYQEWVWTRSRDCALSPGAPLPLVGGIHHLLDQIVFEELDKNGMSYRMAFTSPYQTARLVAATAGMGLMAYPATKAPDPLVAATEYFLPKLPPIQAGVWVRRGADLSRAGWLPDLLCSLARSSAGSAAPRSVRRNAAVRV